MNNKQIRASVAMAVYDGEKYLREQIESILPMLTNNDELIISYDKSSDSTLKIIKEYENNYKNVRVVFNDIKGVSNNFTNAAVNCRGKYIMFSDQDDVWLDNKIEKIVNKHESTGADLIIHDGYLTDKYLRCYPKTLHQMNNASVNPFKNFFKGRFLGCCMSFKRDTLKYILPFPNITSDFPHDIYAAILVGIKGEIVVTDDLLIKHRLHDDNETPKKRNSVPIIIRNRIILLYEIIKRLLKGDNFDF